jgi:Fur family zinc uptake transcriptional regulator
MDQIAFETHDHAACIAEGVAAADAVCREKGLHFTPVRRRVLEILLARHKAMGAYEILDVLRAEGLGSQPPVAYRALDFLVSNGFAHKIERLNAFIACAHHPNATAPAFLICRVCKAVAEAWPIRRAACWRRPPAESGFTIERAVVEAEGVCPNCREGPREPGRDRRAGGVASAAQTALSGVDFHRCPGEIVTIVGPNGSGKSTLLRAMIGAVRPSAGRCAARRGCASAMSRSGCISTRRCR